MATSSSRGGAFLLAVQRCNGPAAPPAGVNVWVSWNVLRIAPERGNEVGHSSGGAERYARIAAPQRFSFGSPDLRRLSEFRLLDFLIHDAASVVMTKIHKRNRSAEICRLPKGIRSFQP
jgi:hypothetical protein